MASTRTIRKRAQQKVFRGNAMRWAVRHFMGEHVRLHTERLKECNWPESIAAALREVDQL